MKVAKPFYLIGLVVVFGCSSSEKIKDDITISEVLVDLKKEIKYSTLSNSLKKYELKFERIVSPELNIVLYTFNSDKIRVEELILKIKEIKGVEDAQTNKKITNRR
jgi:hypothetical protein